MRSLRFPSYTCLLFFVAFLPLATQGYFEVTYPPKGTIVGNGTVLPVTWKKGLLDGVEFLDLELTRMSQDGLIFIARDIPSSMGGLNIYFDSVPMGDDYFLIFANTTHGAMYGVSKQFSIANSNSSNSTSQPLPSKPTVTVSGGPNPTAQFATTFAQSANGVRPWRPSPVTFLSAGLMSLALLTGAAAVL
ncbi:hypothetical protein BC826DRAFT_1030187 [Russula brevipes]|nr:hypothetical protein BC826DRAFT_1030187 [Russula brevipes]